VNRGVTASANHRSLRVPMRVWCLTDCCVHVLAVQVVLTGGCINVPGFVPRFQSELRALVPSELELVVTAPVVSERFWGGGAGVLIPVERGCIE
jgi:hypothetical protein